MSIRRCPEQAVVQVDICRHSQNQWACCGTCALSSNRQCQREPTRCAQPAAAGVPAAKAACQRMDGWAASQHLRVVQASCCCWQCLIGWWRAVCKLPQTEGQRCRGLQHLLQQGCGRAAEIAGGAAPRPRLPGRESGCLHARASPHAPLCCAQRARTRRRGGPPGARCLPLTGGGW